jgi:hypothetical protein
MPSNSNIFAGVELSSGRKPVTFAALDEDLNIKLLEKWDIAEAVSKLTEYGNIWLAVSLPSLQRGKQIHTDFKEKISQAGFQSFSQRNNTTKQWIETNPQDCFRALIGQNLLSRRTLEGRLQRSAVLYEQGLQMTDPMDIFEEITRYKLIQGILPLENLPSSKELDALGAAYLAWMVVNRPRATLVQGEFALPVRE